MINVDCPKIRVPPDMVVLPNTVPSVVDLLLGVAHIVSMLMWDSLTLDLRFRYTSHSLEKSFHFRVTGLGMKIVVAVRYVVTRSTLYFASTYRVHVWQMKCGIMTSVHVNSLTATPLP